MTVQVSWPGVYIEEFAPGAPIQGVGTNTAAFIGPAAGGDINEPTKITSWEQFLKIYGAESLPGFYLWYAVRGFFQNGGQVCYTVRASNGSYSTINVPDRSPANNDLMTVRARAPGAMAIKITVAAKNLLAGGTTNLYRPTGALAGNVVGREVTLKPSQAGNFRPGDFITIANGGERAQIIRISGDVLRIDSNLNNAYAANDTVRLADAPAGTKVFRIESSVPVPLGALVQGTMLTITPQGGTADSQIVESVQIENLPGPKTTYRVTLRAGTLVPISLAKPVAVQSEEFDITVTQGTGSTLYANLSIDSAHPRHFARSINGDPAGLVRVSLVEPPPPVAAPLNLPKTIPATPLTPGKLETLSSLADQHYIDALDALRAVDDVNLIAIPDRQTAAVQQEMITHCEQMTDRFAVLDALPGLELFGNTLSIEAQRRDVPSMRGYAGLYYPWLRVPPAGSGDPILVPPSGHVCGIIARSDANRGVHKAPANEIVNGALGVERGMGDIDHGQLNLQGINVVRVFQGSGRPVLYGARTTADDTNWQYVNIRRLFLYLEESIQEGIRWAVFEPNNLQLWKKLQRTISDFLTRAWRDGALFGAKGEGDAFYVRIDETLNPFSEQQQGRLHIEIGVRPSYPAEFIIVRIGIWSGTIEINE